MRRSAVLLGAVALLSCTSDRRPAAPTSSSSSSVAIPTTAPTTTASAVPTTSSPLSAITGCPDPGPLRAPDPLRPHYTASATVDVASSTVAGSVTVTFTPDLDTREIVFRLWPNAPLQTERGVHEDIGDVTRDDGTVLPVGRPDDTTVHAVLPDQLHAGQSITVTVPYSLVVPGPTPDRVAHDGDTMRLGSFLPLLAWEPGVGWATDPSTRAHAEAATSPAADYDVTLQAPGYDVLGSGERDGDHWHASAVRDVAYSIGHFALTEADVDGVHITLGVDQSVPDDPARYVRLITNALTHYEARLGAYPWPTYTAAVLPGFEGGIEFPSHVMHATGSADRSIVHELAHQWFYALVGNDQGRDPWLDEALASYTEFVEVGSLARHAAESIPSDAAGHAGDSMTYWDDHQADYYRGVYVQGAEAVASLGTVDQVDCALRRYIAHNAFRIASPADLVDALSTVFPDAAARLAPYGLHP